MRRNLFIITFFSGASSLSAQTQKQGKTIAAEVQDNWNQPKTDAPVVINLHKLHTGFEVRSAIIVEGMRGVSSQLNDLNRDRKMDGLAFVVDLPVHGKKTFQVTLSSGKNTKTYPEQVYADMFIVGNKEGRHRRVRTITVPGTSNIYSMVCPHDPILELELVGYRLYFNEKQTPGIYGKSSRGLGTKESWSYPTDEQLVKGLGDNVLRVLDSCEPDALKGQDGQKATHITSVNTRTERIVSYGPVRVIAEIEIVEQRHQDQEPNMMTHYTPCTRYRDLYIEAFSDELLDKETFYTGVQDIVGTSKSFSDHKGLVGSWGIDWLVNDIVKYAKEAVGLGICIPQRYVESEEKGEISFLYTITAPGNKCFQCHTTSTSVKETFEYKTPGAWFARFCEWREELVHPATVRIKGNRANKQGRDKHN